MGYCIRDAISGSRRTVQRPGGSRGQASLKFGETESVSRNASKMIPRAAQRLETAWLTSRQSLPRPARLYSTPSRPSNAPALAAAQLTRQDFPAYMGKPVQEQSLESFLLARAPCTFLPPPLPVDKHTLANELLYGHSPTQDLLAVMDACLFDLFDVPRAKDIFDRLRSSENNPIVEPKIYNAFLEAYLNMAIFREPDSRDYWVESAWNLYEIMESGAEKVAPVSGTYAIMLLHWLRYALFLESEDIVLTTLSIVSTPNPQTLSGMQDS
jgi:DNA-directed RNA polymerase